MPRRKTHKRMPGLTGRFRGPHPFLRGDEEAFFGRETDLTELGARLTNPRFRLAVLEGPSGVGKTSLILGGISKHFAQAQDAPLLLYVDASRGLKDQMSRAIDELSGTSENTGHPTERLPALVSALERKLILVIDHIDMVLVGKEPEWEEDRELLSKVSQGAVSGALPGLLLVADRHRFAQLAGLLGRSKIGIAPGMLLRLEPLNMEDVRRFIEQGVLASGRYLETGMAALIAQDIGGYRPVLPLHLQVLLAGVFQTGRVTARRYLSAGGATHVMADWIEESCRSAGGSKAMETLSLLADEETDSPTWVSMSRVAALTGTSEKQVTTLIQSLVESGLVLSWDGRCRLASQALVPLVRRVDGHLRHARRRADKILEKRTAGRMPLLPHELPLVLPFANTEKRRAMVRRAAWMWGGGLAFLLLLVAGLLVALQVAAVRRRSLDISDRNRPDATLVLRKGGGMLTRWALLPTTPPFGTVVVDTAVPASALATPLSSPRLVESNAAAPSPGWFRDMLGLVTPRRRLELALASNPDDVDLWRKLSNFSDTDSRSRVLDLVGLLGRGRQEELALISSSMEKGGELRRRAVLAALALSMRSEHLGVRLDASKSAAVPISDEEIERLLAAMPRCRALRTASAVARPTRFLLWKGTIENNCKVSFQKTTALSVGARDPVVAARGFQLLARLTQRDASSMAIQILDALPRAYNRNRMVRLASGLEPKLKGVDVPAASIVALADIVRTARSPRTVRAAAALLTRLGKVPVKTADNMAVSQNPLVRVRAAAIYHGILSINPSVRPAALSKLLQDPDESVQKAALTCYGLIPSKDSGRLLRMVTGGDAAIRASAMLPFALTKTGAPDPYKVARFLYLNAKSGEPGLLGSAAQAAAHLVTRPSHWDVAKFFVLPATHAPHPEDRRLAVSAVLELAAVNASAAFKYVDRLSRDVEAKVRLAVVRAVEELSASKRRANATALAPVLGRLASDSNPQVAQAAIWALLDPHMGKDAETALSKALGRILARGGKPAAMAALLWPMGPAGAPASKMLLDSLIRAVHATTDPADAATVLSRLAEIKSPRATQVIVEAASMPPVAPHAMKLACKMGHPSIDAARRALDSSDSKARRAALECLAARQEHWNDDMLRKRIEPLASSPGPLRVAALGALATCASCRASVKRLLERLSRSALTGDRLVAARSASHLGDSSQKLLAGLIDDPTLEVRRAATLSLAEVWSRKDSPSQLAEIIEHSAAHRGRRHAAFLALCLHRDHVASRKVLDRLQSDPCPLVRIMAKAALSNQCGMDTTGRPALAHLIDILFLY